MRAPGDQGCGRRCVVGRGNPADTLALSGPGTGTRGGPTQVRARLMAGVTLAGCGLRPGECGFREWRGIFEERGRRRGVSLAGRGGAGGRKKSAGQRQ